MNAWYESLAEYSVAFAAGREFDKCGVIFELYPKSLSTRCFLEFDGQEDRKGSLPGRSLYDQATVAARGLAEATSAASGQQVWGLRFTLHRDGKFGCEFDYNKPEDYEEELISVSPMNLHLPPGSEEAEAWLDYERKRDLHSAEWGLGTEVEWKLELNEGVIRWIFGDGRIVKAAVQVVGTLNTKDGSFLWGWDHPSIPEPMRQAAKKMREWGAHVGAEDVTQRMIAMDEFRAWALTAVAMQVTRSSGAYRVSSAGTLIYMVFSEPITEQASGRDLSAATASDKTPPRRGLLGALKAAVKRGLD